MLINNLLSNFHLTASWDLLVIVIFIGVAFLYGLTLGKNRLIILLLSTYFSLVIVGSIPWRIILTIFGLKDLPSPTFKIFLFLAIILFFLFLIPHSVLGSSLGLGKHSRSSWFQILILSVLQIGLLASIILSFLSPKVIIDLNPLVKQFFLGQMPQFFWLSMPILAMIFLRRKEE